MKVKGDRITVKEAAERMGICAPLLRKSLRIGVFPFGWAIQDNHERCSYYISRSLFEEYIKGEKEQNEER